MEWELEEGGTLGQGYECEPVQYPRTNENRGQSDDMNKGAASTNDSIALDRQRNTIGDEQSPRNEEDVKYNVGPYPVVELEQDEGDENGQA